MTKFRRILFPTDFSQNSKVALAYACMLAEQNEAELHVLYVRDAVDYYLVTLDFVMAPGVDPESGLAEIEKCLGEVVDPGWSKSHQVIQAVRRGSPFLEIVRYAKEKSIDLIVMGTHGRTGLTHLLLGSVAENVVRTATCPVLTVHPDDYKFVMP